MVDKITISGPVGTKAKLQKLAHQHEMSLSSYIIAAGLHELPSVKQAIESAINTEREQMDETLNRR